jgi:hypothetical protein
LELTNSFLLLSFGTFPQTQLKLSAVLFKTYFFSSISISNFGKSTRGFNNIQPNTSNVLPRPFNYNILRSYGVPPCDF